MLVHKQRSVLYALPPLVDMQLHLYLCLGHLRIKKMRKKCQIPTGDEYYFVCNKVYEQTGHSHLVARGVCERLCSDETIEQMSQRVTDWHRLHPTPADYPSLKKMAGNLLLAAAKQFKAGNPKRPEAEQKKVMAKCRACPFYDGEARGGPRCKSCGCFLIKKIEWATTSCSLPKPKWLPYSPPATPQPVVGS